MASNERELYRSANGDRWCLSRESEFSQIMVKHVPNAASGGRTSFIEVGPFLASGGHGPEHQELLRLIGTLVSDGSADRAQLEPTDRQAETQPPFPRSGEST